MKKEAVEITIDNLMSKIKHYYPSDMEVITRAFNLAYEAHMGQVRSSGRPYITHPCVVCDILADLGMDVPTLCAALLHDTVEDTPVTDAQLRAEFGDEVADLVKGVTKLDKLQFSSKEEEQAENIRKMFFAMAKDIRVLIIKLADRLHNMRSLSFLSTERQQAMAKETFDIFAPLAGRLGISQVKCELEDLCLKFLHNDIYENLANTIALKKEERQALVDTVIFQLNSLLSELNVKGEISGRTKHFYSIYKKMKNQGKSLDEIYDLTAVRVVVETVKDCYNVLGGIHALWKPMPKRFKDYIAVPKANMYQSLHTTVMTNLGAQFEIQIKTHEMHKIAEYGIAAHWKYKEGAFGQPGKLVSKLTWLDDVMASQSELKDSKEFLNVVKNDISISNEVFVFTPKGDVRNLTMGATALDFAYAVHSEVGNRCVGAKVNSKIANLNTVLQNGDVLEIMTSANSKGPSRDWLKVATTTSARTKIRQFFKREMKDEHTKNGKAMLERESKHRGYNLSQLMSEKALETVFRRYLFNDVEEMFASVGYGSVTTNQILIKLVDYFRKHIEKIEETDLVAKPKVSKNSNGVLIKGYDDLLIRFSKCCSPVPGDGIIGYISRGRGVTIHRSDCCSVKGLEKERLVEATWSKSTGSQSFPVAIQILSEDKGEVFAEITKTISNAGLPLLAINARKDKNHNAVANVTIEISNHEQLNALIEKLKSNPNTLEVFRTNN